MDQSLLKPVHTYKDSRGNEIDHSRYVQLKDQTQSPGNTYRDKV